MGIYINKGDTDFRDSIRDEYVDKTGLIGVVNRTLNATTRFSCVTRCRRFGKSMAAKMLCAYYDHSADSHDIFDNYAIASDATYDEHINKYPVLYVDMQEFVARYKKKDIVSHIQKEIISDIHEAFSDVPVKRGDDLMAYVLRVVMAKGKRFVFIIDEWDSLCREYMQKPEVMNEYFDLLRGLFKGVNANTAFAGAYMTGILPIKKFETQSALNNFIEYSMVRPGGMASFFGFTRNEVKGLAEAHGMDFEELEKWYDGYQIGPELSMFNPNSVMEAIRNQWCESYWGATAAFTSISGYIDKNYDGLKDNIVNMLAGGRCIVDPSGFLNDLSEIRDRDDVLTVLIHLGYLSYDRRTQECYIPNREVAGEMVKAVKENKWKPVMEALDKSRQLLDATLRGDAATVARMVADVHSMDTSILSYNTENSLACVISLAYYYARNDYHVHREFATGCGYADMVLIPRKNVDKPAIIVELKKDHNAVAAIAQIKERNYPQLVEDYTGDILFVGINYDTDTKQHTCQIERWRKE